MKLIDLGYTSKKQFLKVLFVSSIKTAVAVIVGFLIASHFTGAFATTTFIMVLYVLLFLFCVGLNICFGAPKKSFLVNGICTITKKKEECDEICDTCMRT